MSIEALNAEPPEVTIDDLVSGREYIKRRRFVEILPDSTSGYGSVDANNAPLGNYRTTFNIGSSGTEFLDSINSYFRLKLQCRTEANGANFVSPYLDEGGIHAFIKSLTIQLRNGTRIEHIDHYNKLYCMKRNATMSPGQVDNVSAFESGDSMAFQPYPDPTYFFSDIRTNTSYADEADFNQVNADATNAGNDINQLKIREPARRLYANGTQRSVTFKLLSDFLSHYKYLPLPMLQQLQIVIEWERPQLAFSMYKKATGNGALANIGNLDLMNYNISEIRYVANMVEVSDTVLMNFQKAYETTGISLPYITYRAFRSNLTTDAAGATVELQAALNSVRYGLMAIMESECFTESNNAKGYRSQSTFRKAGLTSYAFRSGGYVFPDHGPVRTDTTYSAEAFSQLMIALNQHQNTLLDTSMRQWEWNDVNTTVLNGSAANKTIVDATKFIIGVDFTKIDDYSGLDTTGNNIIVELNFGSLADGVNGAAATRNLLCFLAYDSVLNLSKQMGTLVQY
jgi:hypothetical protein